LRSRKGEKKERSRAGDLLRRTDKEEGVLKNRYECSQLEKRKRGGTGNKKKEGLVLRTSEESRGKGKGGNACSPSSYLTSRRGGNLKEKEETPPPSFSRREKKKKLKKKIEKERRAILLPDEGRGRG